MYFDLLTNLTKFRLSLTCMKHELEKVPRDTQFDKSEKDTSNSGENGFNNWSLSNIKKDETRCREG